MNYGVGATSPIANAAEPKRLTEVQEQVHRSGQVVGRMEEKIKYLADRLQPVLRVSGSGQQGKDNTPPRPTLVGHAAALSNHNDQLEMMDGFLGEILDRLEL